MPRLRRRLDGSARRAVVLLQRFPQGARARPAENRRSSGDRDQSRSKSPGTAGRRTPEGPIGRSHDRSRGAQRMEGHARRRRVSLGGRRPHGSGGRDPDAGGGERGAREARCATSSGAGARRRTADGGSRDQGGPAGECFAAVDREARPAGHSPFFHCFLLRADSSCSQKESGSEDSSLNSPAPWSHWPPSITTHSPLM